MNTERRRFLQVAGLSMGAVVATPLTPLGQTTTTIVKSPNGRSLGGVFPIGWTPCTPDNKFNVDAMAKQQQFLNRGKVAGMSGGRMPAAGRASRPGRNGMPALRRWLRSRAIRPCARRCDTAGLDVAASQDYLQEGQEPECRRHHFSGSRPQCRGCHRLFQGAGRRQRPADHGPGRGRCQCRALVALAEAVPTSRR